MTYTLRFPITLKNEVTGALRPAKANEIEFGIDCTGNALTEFPRDKAAGVIWFEGTSVVVKKMYPSWCPAPMPFCEPTEPLEAGKEYVGSVSWMANKSYRTEFAFYLAESETTKTVPLTLVIPSGAPPPNGPPPNGDYCCPWCTLCFSTEEDLNKHKRAEHLLKWLEEWVTAHPLETAAIGVGVYLLVGRK